jgi:hypothetical protein
MSNIPSFEGQTEAQAAGAICIKEWHSKKKKLSYEK